LINNVLKVQRSHWKYRVIGPEVQFKCDYAIQYPVVWLGNI